MFVLHVKAYAKVNFGLQVFPRREDGFHNIEGIFQTIDLYDELIVSESKIPGCKVVCKSMDLPEKNTLTVAYEAFCKTVGTDVNVPGVNIELIKGIPAGGGLGGGSADGAALVRALEQLCNISLSYEQKDYIAAQTGSDVFFFIHGDKEGKNCAIVSGRGEIIKKIEPRKDLFLLLILPSCNSITKEAYSLLDKFYEGCNSVKCPSYSELETVYNSSIQDWTFKNSFTPVVMNAIPDVRNAIGDLQKEGCCYAEMSGSGSTVFGVFTNVQQVQAINNLLSEKWTCKPTKTI